MPLFGLSGGSGSPLLKSIDANTLRTIGKQVINSGSEPGLIHLIDPSVLGGLAAQVTGQPQRFGTGGGGATVVTPPTISQAPEFYAEIERQMMLNPAGLLSRHFAMTYLGATFAAGVMTASPQENVIPVKMVCKSGEIAGTVQSLEVALKPLQFNAFAEPAANFHPDNFESNWLPPVTCKVGQDITAITTGLTAMGFICACLDRPLISPASFLARASGNVLAVGAGATATITIRPEEDMKLRRLLMSFAGAGDRLATVGDVKCGVKTQFESGAGIPAEMFDAQAPFGFVDGDIVRPGQSFTCVITNHDVAAHDFTLTILGDAVES